MGWFRRPDPRDAFIAQLRAELSDTRAQLLAEREQASEERAKLLDQLMALANPLALREMRRPSPGASVASAPIPKPNYYPRSEHLVVPPYPPTKLPAPLKETP